MSARYVGGATNDLNHSAASHAMASVSRGPDGWGERPAAHQETATVNSSEPAICAIPHSSTEFSEPHISFFDEGRSVAEPGPNLTDVPTCLKPVTEETVKNDKEVEHSTPVVCLHQDVEPASDLATAGRQRTTRRSSEQEHTQIRARNGRQNPDRSYEPDSGSGALTDRATLTSQRPWRSQRVERFPFKMHVGF